MAFDASRSNPIYGNSDTVQPDALSCRYIIKAFNGQTPNSALIDITQYAQELANKADRDLDNLSAAGEAKLNSLDNNFTIIYPNGGSAASPANITADTRYVESNPYPGYYVDCIAEVYMLNQWVQLNWNVDAAKYGISCSQLNDGNIVILPGTLYSTAYNMTGCVLSPLPTTNITSAPCRVKVWKIGKIPTA
jgi:hypothetical protein